MRTGLATAAFHGRRVVCDFLNGFLRTTFLKKTLTAQDLLAQLQRRGPMFSDSDLKDLEKTHDKLSTLPDDPWRTNR